MAANILISDQLVSQLLTLLAEQPNPLLQVRTISIGALFAGLNLTREFWVDKSTTTPAADQNGNIEAPFNTITKALQRCTNAALTYVIHVAFCDGDYSAEVFPVAPAVAATRIAIMNDGPSTFITWGGGGQNMIALPGWVCPATQLMLVGCQPIDIVQVANLACYWCDLNRIICTGNVELYNTRELNQWEVGGNILTVDSFVTGELTATQTDPGLNTFKGSRLGLQHYRSVAPFGVRHNIACEGCEFVGNIDTGGVADTIDLTIRAGQFPAGAVTFDGSAGVGCIIELDDSTFATMHAPQLPGFTPTVRSRRQTATITVAVPALAAGELGYVNVATAGTELAGIPQDTPIIANPIADLEAAGAGKGGLLQVRVSAASTIRLAFEGGLTGGNVDFVFSSVNGW